MLYLSSYIEQRRKECYSLLQYIRRHGEWQGWLQYFFRAVRDSARSAICQSDAIISLRDRNRNQLTRQHTALALLDTLSVNP